MERTTLQRNNTGNQSSAAAAAAAAAPPPLSGSNTNEPYYEKNKHSNNMGRGGACGGGGVCGGFQCMSSIRVTVLLVLCLQNSMFTVLRRYSQGILKENYSKYEVLMVGEFIKMLFSVWMIRGLLEEGVVGPADPSTSSTGGSGSSNNPTTTLLLRLQYLFRTSRKMFVLATIYGAMNILSFVSLRNIGAGIFTIFAQCKILTTATFSSILLQRKYSATQWRALVALMCGVLLFSEPIWGNSANFFTTDHADANPALGTAAVLLEVTLSGFASIYFEKVIKTDPLQLNIWERNFQLALGSIPVYVAFIAWDGGGPAEAVGGGWTLTAWILTLLGAGGGLLVALSIKYGDSVLKTLATTGAIVLSSVLDHALLDGPLTPTMMIAGVQVIVAICNYAFDATPPTPTTTTGEAGSGDANKVGSDTGGSEDRPMNDEEIALIEKK